jgi:hypothetical protein
VKRIDILPDDVLLGIFDFYANIMSLSYRGKTGIEAWQSLVHVCRRWRSLVLESPRRLNLRLFCTPETPARDTLDVWPALPLIVSGSMYSSGKDPVFVALEQSNRVCKVDLWGLAGRQLEVVFAVMQVPFPELTDLRLSSDLKRPPVIPDSFLGGSAPRLRLFTLDNIPFPGSPKLLSSATHLVYLNLRNIPYSGYISPEAMIALLSVLSSLRIFSLEFRPFQYRPDRESRILPPPTRLPALEEFRFMGVTKYLEDLVTFIEAPQLDQMRVMFINEIDFDCPRLAQFINRTSTLWVRAKARVQFDNWSTGVALLAPSRTLEIETSHREPDFQLSSIVQICNSSLYPLSTVEDLYIEHRHWELVWKEYSIKNTLWLQLLLSFAAVKNLYLSKEFVPGIAATLQELIGGRITDVLPGLQNIFVEGLEPSRPLQKNIKKFVTARRLSGHPVAISVWNGPAQDEGEDEEESALSCKHSTLASIRREADILVFTQRRNCGRNWRGFLASTQGWYRR